MFILACQMNKSNFKFTGFWGFGGQHQVSEFADLAIIKVSPLGGTDAVERLIEKLDVFCESL